MGSLKTIRRRIASVKSTQKITKAMKLVAAARLRRAQQSIVALRPYAKKTAEVLANVASRAADGNEEKVHPLLVPREVKTVLILAISGDRGLAGAYNANVQRGVDRRIRELGEQGITAIKLATIGRKGREYFRRRNMDILHDLTGAYEGGARRAAEIGRLLIEEYESGNVDQVLIAYTEFKTAITQKFTLEQLIPVQPVAANPEASESRELTTSTEAGAGAATSGDFIYEPDKSALLERLLPMYVETAVYRAMLESIASEYGARMTAMDSATKNAKEMIGSLTLQYNRARQAAITKELMEIIGGAEALKG